MVIILPIKGIEKYCNDQRKTIAKNQVKTIRSFMNIGYYALFDFMNCKNEIVIEVDLK